VYLTKGKGVTLIAFISLFFFMDVTSVYDIISYVPEDSKPVIKEQPHINLLIISILFFLIVPLALMCILYAINMTELIRWYYFFYLLLPTFLSFALLKSTFNRQSYILTGITLFCFFPAVNLSLFLWFFLRAVFHCYR
jgi:hypothetical protein